ncbi:MAG: FAD/NAD(P)-binding protein [Sulfitobacter sp.]
MNTLPRIALIGAGPMAIYTLKNLLKSQTPLDITLYDRAAHAGAGMPYRAQMNADYMYCNAFSKEIPPITRRLVTWLHDQTDSFLAAWDLTRDDIDARDFYPRVLIGEFLCAELRALCDEGRSAGHSITILPRHDVVDVVPEKSMATLHIRGPNGTSIASYDRLVLATGHSWPKSPKIGAADLVSPWPYSRITALPPGKIGILGSSLSAIDVIVALGHEHGSFIEKAGRVDWFPKEGRAALAVTMVSHKGIMPEPDFFYPYPYEPLTHVSKAAIKAEIAKGSQDLLRRSFALLIAELNETAPEYMAELGPEAQSIEGFAEAYFDHRMRLGGLRALRDTLKTAENSKEAKQTQPHRYALLRGHENFELIFEHMDDDDWQLFNAALMPVFGDCYAAIPHISVRRVLAMYEAGALEIIPTGPEGSFKNTPSGGACVTTIDGDLEFTALIDARGQAPAALGDLPFPTLAASLADPDAALMAPYRLSLKPEPHSAIYCLAMPQILAGHPFSQGLANCAEHSRTVAGDILHSLNAARA